MTSGQLVKRGLAHYWRTNLAVIAGVAAAVTVLSGALLVGDSVRGSLRDLVVRRLGATDLALVSTEFFREALAADLRADPAFTREFKDVAPLIATQGAATHQESSRRASRVQVYGVDERFWRFHGTTAPTSDSSWQGGSAAPRDVLLSPALARELDAEPGSTVLLRLQKPSAIPLESLHGRKDDVGQTVRLTVRAVVPAAALGEFSLQAQQGEVRAAFVPLARLQQDLGLTGRVNTLLVSLQPTTDAGTRGGHFENLVRRHATPADLGLTLRVLPAQGVLSLESGAALIDKRREEAATAAARQLGMTALPVLTYLANTMRAGDRVVPYSLVTAYELSVIAPDVHAEETSRPPVVLNDWAARELNVKVGDQVRMDYFVWEDPGRLAATAFLPR